MFTMITIHQKCPLRRQIQSALGILRETNSRTLPLPGTIIFRCSSPLHSPHSVSVGSASIPFKQLWIHPSVYNLQMQHWLIQIGNMAT